MKTSEVQTVGQIVADDYRTAQVFRSFRLDFCCGGDKTVEEACEKRGVDAEEVWSALAGLGSKVSDQQNYNNWSLGFLADYIENNHHEYIRSKSPEIEFYAQKVAKVHGANHPELMNIYHIFTELKSELLSHLDKEEEILFPYIKKLTQVDAGKLSMEERPEFGSAAAPVAMMEAEHEEAGELMEKIQDLSDDFNPPADACTTYRLLFQNLDEFQQDLHKHVHLENNILFPKALKLEYKLNGAGGKR